MAVRENDVTHLPSRESNPGGGNTTEDLYSQYEMKPNKVRKVKWSSSNIN